MFPDFLFAVFEGKVLLPSFKAIQSFLNELMDYKIERTVRKFRDNIRVYNSMFQMTSIGDKIDQEINKKLACMSSRLVDEIIRI